MVFSRRSFLAGLASTATISQGLFARSVSDGPRDERIFPKPLAAGQTVALIAPASNASENEDIRYAADILHSFGFQVRMGKNLFERWGYLAGTDAQRAADVNAAFADPEVDAIIALRGGYGTMRILPHIDYKLIKSNPKVLLGYSDLTALLNAIHRKTGLVTFHGPIAKQEYSDYTLAEFKKVMFNPEVPTPLGSPPAFTPREGHAERNNRLLRIHSGKARGRLVGGNLSLLARTAGTPYEAHYKNKILFMEEIGEEPYRIDSMLSQLWLAGRFQECAGIVFGKCSDCDAEGPNSLTLETLLRDRLGYLGIPVLSGLMFGHISDQTTLPIGCEAELDVEAGTLTLLEAGVRNS
ncbi:MAG: LD-carboxypeptidase [Acidobacteria bacterium]|nr:LD-carboxypeptidase [Acidobacteriota bacterium]MCB9397177.1 LD-carboxypeptidase [Acidobacteriota bacterium]